MHVIERLLAPTPVFFKKLRSIGLALTAVAGVIMTAPVALPAAVVSAAGYMALAGSVVAAVAQLTKDDQAMEAEINRFPSALERKKFRATSILNPCGYSREEVV
jgi:hypothetical protein